MKQRLVCITGMDATGKSTVIQNLLELKPAVSEIWDLLRSGQAYLPFENKAEVDGYLCSLTPNSRLMFLSHALRYSVDIALQRGVSIVLLNAYVYKYFASELAMGAAPTMVKKIMEEFPNPNLVIKLNVSAEVAADRKTEYSRYECGCSLNPGRGAFIEFQQLVKPQWNTFEHRGWHELDGEGGKEDIAEEVLAIINSA